LNLLKWTKETKQKVEGAQEKKKGDRDPTRCDSAAASSRPLIALKRDKKKTHKKKKERAVRASGEWTGPGVQFGAVETARLLFFLLLLFRC
jgi:hypothetical protein